MSLTNYPFVFYDNDEDFLQETDWKKSYERT